MRLKLTLRFLSPQEGGLRELLGQAAYRLDAVLIAGHR
jgi:hypothetical protein